MTKPKKKSYTIEYICVGTPEQSDRILRQIAKCTLQKVLKKHGAIAHNLDEVLEKYINHKNREGHV